MSREFVMPLTALTKARVVGISDGSVMPETGMERHFLRVCRGEAGPACAEEREWLRYVEACRAEQAAEDREHLAEALRREVMLLRHELQSLTEKGRAESAESAEKVARSRSQLAQLEVLIKRQQECILELVEDNKRLKARIPSLTPELDAIERDRGGFHTCPVCRGDGGAAGQCWKCGGSGWLRADDAAGEGADRRVGAVTAA